MSIHHVEAIENLEDVLRAGKLGHAFVAQTRSVAQLFSMAANVHPQRHALCFLRSANVEDAATTSFHEMHLGIQSTAAFLSRLGIAKDDVVSILLPAMPQAHLALWGGMTAGIANPVNTLLTRDALAAQLNSVGAKVLIALGPHPVIDIWQRVRGLESVVPTLQTIVQVDVGSEADPNYPTFDRLLAEADPGQFHESPDPERVAALFHTGGTTGSAKVVQLTHRNLIAAAWSTVQSYRFTPEDIVLCGLPLFHVGGAIDGGLSVLAAGSCIVIPTIGGMRNPEVVRNFWRIVERTHTTIVAMVPTSFAGVVNVPVLGSDLSSLEFSICGGSPIPLEIARKFEALSKAPIHELFGMTECAGIASCNPRASSRRLGSAGLPVPMTDIAVKTHAGLVGLDQLPTQTGEIWIRGPNVFRGYRDTLHNQGVVLSEGWVATGDLGHLDADGYLWVTGRKKDLIIRSGHNIDPQSIENIAAEHPGVALVAAVGQPDDYAGEVPILFVVPSPGARLSSEEIWKFVADRISEPPAKPRSVEILDEMPLTPLGKIFKPRLRAIAAQKVVCERLTTALSPRAIRAAANLDAHGRMTVRISVGSMEGDIAEALGRQVAELLGHLPVVVTAVELF